MGTRRPNLFDLNPGDQQATMRDEIEIREIPFAGAHLRHGNVVVAGMFRVARMFVIVRMQVIGRARAVDIGYISVAVKHWGVEMYASRSADIAVSVHMHVEAAELNGKEAHASGDKRRGSQTAHSQNCSISI